MKKLLLLVAVLLVQTSYAQTQDAWVFFADKEDVAASISNPISILTQEALDRKQLHGVVIDERDVPVNETYISDVKAATGIQVLAKSKWMNCVYVQGTLDDINNLLDLSFVTSVEYADKDLNLFPTTQAPSDKFEMENATSRIEYDYGAAANQTVMISADYLHEQDFIGTGMVIASLDSGFPNMGTNVGFADLNADGRLLGTYNFVERNQNVTGTGSHGSRTLSDMAGIIDNEFVGTAPGASYYLFRTEYSPTEVPVEEAYWVEALERSDSLGVDVVNTSLGYQDYDNANYDHSYADLDGLTTFAARGANLAFEKGMLLVTSAGNDGGSFGFVATPADAPGVLTVGAVDSSGNYASFSSFGPNSAGVIKPDVMAQGASAAVIDQNGNVTFSSGTSFSSPIMAGAVASLWQRRPETTNEELMQIIRESSSTFDNPTSEFGYGIPNFEEAFDALSLLSTEDFLQENNFGIYPNPVEDKVFVSFPNGFEKATIKLYSVLGKEVFVKSISARDNGVNISQLTSGMYLARIESGNTAVSFKLIKK